MCLQEHTEEDIQREGEKELSSTGGAFLRFSRRGVYNYEKPKKKYKKTNLPGSGNSSPLGIELLLGGHGMSLVRVVVVCQCGWKEKGEGYVLLLI